MAEITKGLGNPSKQLSENTVWKKASEHSSLGQELNMHLTANKCF